MKRLLIGFTILLALSTAASANIFVDGYGAFIGTDDAKYQYGGGGALGLEITREFSILYRGMYTMYTKESSLNDPVKREFNHQIHAVGLEYRFPYDRFRIEWRTSFMVGFSMTELNYTPTSGPSLSTTDMGASIAAWTGIQYNATQHISPFFDFGLHGSLYAGKLKEASIWGINMLIGVRYYIGNNRGITDNY